MSEPCRLCGSGFTVEVLTPRDNILYHRCESCGYVAMDKRYRMTPEDEKLRYEQHNNNSGNEGYVKWLNTFLDFALEPLPLQDASILDFGSGPEPVMAGLMAQRGYKVAIEDPFFAPGERPGRFDVITSLEVFEHLNNPFDVLSTLVNRLNDGGRICIGTKFLPESKDDFDSWHYRNDSTHIGFFTEQGLCNAAVRIGLSVERCDGIRYINFHLAHRGASC